MTNSVEDGLQYIFVESLIKCPHVKWFDSSAADNTNKIAIRSNQHNCCSSNHHQKSGWRGYTEIPILTVYLYHILCSLRN